MWQAADGVLLTSTVAQALHRTGAHLQAAWSAEPRDRMSRLASGDTEGRVVVWDVASGGVIVALDDALTVTCSCCWQHIIR